jgi:sulfite reductase (NADPH) flavoprotein alpha-component
MSALPAQILQLQNKLNSLASTLDERETIWASGYLAGLAAGGQVPAVAPSASPKPATSRTLTIWYGSETGNARRVAEGLAEAAGAQGLTVKLANLADVRPQDIRKQERLTLVVSTHGEGAPPENAEDLHRFLLSEHAPRLEQLEYAVFALGDSSYEHYCQTGKDFDAVLERLGARRALVRVDADVDFTTTAERWREQALAHFAPASDSDAPPADTTRPTHLHLVSPTPEHYDRDNPFTAEVVVNQPLTVAPSTKSIHHLELSIEGSGIEYQPGDSVGIWADNAPELVDEILQLTGLNPADTVERDGQRRSLHDWLSQHLELTQLSRPVLQAYADLAGAEALHARLAESQTLQAWISQHQLVDILRLFPAQISATNLVTLLRGMSPRLYSIASSPSTTPDELHLTVSTVGGRGEQGLRAGTASWYLNQRLAVGDRVRLFVQDNPQFRIPQAADAPTIMIGPGTGIAPFRAFVNERQALGHTGRNWLFFGAPHRRTDFLYQLEWQRHLQHGSLERLSLAFSRDQAEKIYVQDRIRQAGAEFQHWLDAGAHVYICGDAQRMAADVETAIGAVLSEQRGLSATEASEYLKSLRRAGRYQKDVY